jgi:O-antigen/teichoic acid export membrane protein
LAEFRALLGFGGWVTVSSLIAPVLVHIDRFVIAAILGIASVAYYAAPYEMVTRLWLLPGSLLATLFPAFSGLRQTGQHSRIDFLAANAVKYLLLVSGSLAVVVVVHAHTILELWLGEDFALAGTAVLRLLAVGVLVNSLAQVPYSVIQASGRPDLVAGLHLAEVPFHIGLVWWLTALWGIEGAALSWTIRVVVDAAVLYWLGRRLALFSGVAAIREQTVRVLVLLGALGGVAFAADAVTRTIPWRVFGGMAILVGFALVAWRFVLRHEERDHIWGLWCRRREKQERPKIGRPGTTEVR